jgi:hypothetical protein
VRTAATITAFFIGMDRFHAFNRGEKKDRGSLGVRPRLPWQRRRNDGEEISLSLFSLSTMKGIYCDRNHKSAIRDKIDDLPALKMRLRGSEQR